MDQPKTLLDARMKDQGVKDAQIARAIGCTPQHIWRVRNGERAISPALAKKLTDHFPHLISLEELMREMAEREAL